MSTTEQPSAADTAPAVAVVKADPTKKTLAALDWDAAYTELVKRTVLKPKKREATHTELYLFAEQVERTGLNPFLRQIYGIYRFDSQAGDEVMGVQVGIDGFRLIAERTNRYEGQTEQEWCGKDGVWRTVWVSDEKPFAARVGVYKKGHRGPTYAVAHWSEYVQGTSPMWKKMPANMISKCAEALALRKAFPNELSGLYTPDEMAQADNPSLGDGTGNGEPAGLVLGEAIEAILTRAADLGHAALADRSMAEMLVADEHGNVIAAKATEFIRTATAELDAMPTDAQVVADAPQAPVASEAQNVPQAPQDAAEVPQSADDPERIAALRRRGEELLNAAEAAEQAGDDRAADEYHAEFVRVAAEVEAASDANQTALGF